LEQVARLEQEQWHPCRLLMALLGLHLLLVLRYQQLEADSVVDRSDLQAILVVAVALVVVGVVVLLVIVLVVQVILAIIILLKDLQVVLLAVKVVAVAVQEQ
jgi:hypothetical protein